MAKAYNEFDISAVNTIINTAIEIDKEELLQQLDPFCEKESNKKALHTDAIKLRSFFTVFFCAGERTIGPVDSLDKIPSMRHS